MESAYERGRRLSIVRARNDLLRGMENHNAVAVQQAIRNGANVNSVVCFEGRNAGIDYRRTPLMLAVSNHDGSDASHQVVRILLDKGANARWKNHMSLSAILVACQNGHLSIVEMLLDHDNGLLEMAGHSGWTPLITASARHHTEIVRFLLERGANVNATDAKGSTALMVATGYIQRLLLEFGADLEARDIFGRTVLHYATMRGFTEEVHELVLERNADMFAVAKYGHTPLDYAAFHINDEIVECLLQLYGNKMTHDHEGLALHAVLCSAEYSFAAVNEVAFAPVRLPLGKLTLEHCRTLLHHFGIDLIHNPDVSGKLPIHIACQMNAPVEVLTLLVELDPTTLQIADHTGSLPLHLLCRIGTTPTKYASVRYLVEQEGGVGTLAARNHKGALPLHNLVASANPTLATVQYLIESSAGAVTARTDEGLYPFMVAACDTSSASLSVVYELIRANPNLIVRNVPAWYMSWIKVVVALWPHTIALLLGLGMSWLFPQIRQCAPFIFDPVLA